jgi:ubiquinone/menaquinone biosynthesis C-methylase UbiE
MVQIKDAAKKYFDRKSVVYFDEHYKKIDDKYPVLYLRHNCILDMIENVNGRVLDVGCGSGAMLVELSLRGFETLGVDISLSMTKMANELPLKLGVHKPFLSVADIENLPFVDKSFDLIVCAGVIEYLEQDNRALKEISRVLKYGGTTFISVTNVLTPFWFFETSAKIIGFWNTLISFTKRDVSFPKVRLHVPRHLIMKAEEVNLVKEDVAYFHFSPLPAPLNSIFPSLCRRFGLKMETLSKTRLGFLGRGCIIKFVKKNSNVTNIN